MRTVTQAAYGLATWLQCVHAYVCAKYPSRHTVTAAPARFESADVGAKTGGSAKEEARKFETTATKGRGAAAGTGGVRLTNSGAARLGRTVVDDHADDHAVDNDDAHSDINDDRASFRASSRGGSLGPRSTIGSTLRGTTVESLSVLQCRACESLSVLQCRACVVQLLH
eukprot:16177-Heterococcus_DN1.PRE.1